MPRWDFTCNACGTVTRDVPSVRHDPDEVAPDHCGARMELLWETPNQARTFEPYTTTHIDPDGKPITVTSQRQLSSLENKYGLRTINDPHLVMDGGRLTRVSLKDAQHLRGER